MPFMPLVASGSVERWTYAHDKRIKQWCDARKFRHEPPQNGVIRRLKNRDGWARKGEKMMKKPIIDTPDWNPLNPRIFAQCQKIRACA